MPLIKLHLSDSVYLSLFVLHLANSNHNLHTSWELYQNRPRNRKSIFCNVNNIPYYQFFDEPIWDHTCGKMITGMISGSNSNDFFEIFCITN